MNLICINGKMIPGDQPVLMADNRGYRYGDGLFETLKVVDGIIQQTPLHFERLFAGLQLLKFELPGLFTPRKLQDEIIQLCKKNNCEALARVRLSVSRGNGGLYDTGSTMQYVIECWSLNESVNQLNENGLVIDVFPDAHKSCDAFCNLKSANFLTYVMAAQYARENKLNDCLVLNQHGRIADATIANIFLVKDGKIITPPLSEGGVNGVMRRHLLEQLRTRNNRFEAEEKPVFAEDLLLADEIFLTNAVNGLRWVKQFRDKIYTNQLGKEIYHNVLQK